MCRGYVCRIERISRGVQIRGVFPHLAAFLSSIPYDSHDALKSPQATEKHFHYTFYLILRLLGGGGCRLLDEQTQALGRVDCIIEYPQVVYVFEFKLDGSADEALRQIEDRGYAKPYLADKRRLVKVGVNFSSKTSTIADWLEA